MHAVQAVIGAQMSPSVFAVLEQLADDGWQVDQIAQLVEQIAAARSVAPTVESMLDLVLSGPEVDGVPTRETAAVMEELFGRAQSEVILVGYAVHGGGEVFRRLAERMIEVPGLSVWMCLDISRPMGDASHPDEIVRRFIAKFYDRQWPWIGRPSIYYDTRALSSSSTERTSLHAKCVVIDRSIALVTSANFTTAAQQRNIEVGVLLSHSAQVARIAEYFLGLRARGVLQLAAPAGRGQQ